MKVQYINGSDLYWLCSLLVVFEDILYRDVGNLVIDETLNCKREAESLHHIFMNLSYLSLRSWFEKILHYNCPCATCHLMHLHVIFRAWQCHRDNFDWSTTVFPRLAIRIALPHTELMVDCIVQILHI